MTSQVYSETPRTAITTNETCDALTATGNHCSRTAAFLTWASRHGHTGHTVLCSTHAKSHYTVNVAR